jgi:DNA-binding beta-propeller fold protein YncE
VYVLCEGLWRQNNGALSYYQGGAVTRDAMQYVNGNKLGDTPSDMLAIGDTLIIAVNTSQKILLLQRSTGLLLNTLIMPGGREPYRLASDGRKLWASNLNDDSITEFDLASGALNVERLFVGPAPEGLASINNKLYVAISGLGDLRVSEPLAGTLQILRTRDLEKIGEVGGLANAGTVVADAQRAQVWCAYRNLPSKSEALGGVALIDARADTVMQRWELKSPTRLAADPATGDVFVLHEDGVDRLTAGASAARIISHRSVSGADVWYALAYDAQRKQLLVGNARTYVTDGEVLEIALDGVVLNRISVGLNPTSILPAP